MGEEGGGGQGGKGFEMGGRGEFCSRLIFTIAAYPVKVYKIMGNDDR